MTLPSPTKSSSISIALDAPKGHKFKAGSSITGFIATRACKSARIITLHTAVVRCKGRKKWDFWHNERNLISSERALEKAAHSLPFKVTLPAEEPWPSLCTYQRKGEYLALYLKACIVSSEGVVLESCQMPLEVIPVSISRSTFCESKVWTFGLVDCHFSASKETLQAKVEVPKAVTLKENTLKAKISILSSPRVHCSSLRVTLCQKRPGFWNTKNLSQIIVPVPVKPVAKAGNKELQSNISSQVMVKLPLDAKEIAPRSVPSGKITVLDFEAQHYLKVEFLGVAEWYQPEKDMKIPLLFYPIQ